MSMAHKTIAHLKLKLVMYKKGDSLSGLSCWLELVKIRTREKYETENYTKPIVSADYMLW